MLNKLMYNTLENITIRLPELNYFQQLLYKDKISYFLELFETTIHSTNFSSTTLQEGLQDFFNEISEDEYDEMPFFESYDINAGNNTNRVDILVDRENLVVESNSLKAVRSIRDKFLDNGYLLMRDKIDEKLFRNGKITKYLRVYKIIGRASHLCYN